jgi:hypothetical protein
MLQTLDGTPATVVSTEIDSSSATVYNFEIAAAHNYYVGTSTSSTAIRVHNQCKQPTGEWGDTPGFESMDNARPKVQARNAAREAGLTDRADIRTFHDAITGQGITDYQELVQIARDIANGNY